MTVQRLLPSTIFREYDIRGKVDSELFVDQIYNLGCAIAYFLKNKNKDVATVAVGMDGRTHSPKIRDFLIEALQASGLNIINIGLCPSPVLYFAMHTLPIQAGIIVTASHNPQEYNGLKICLGHESVSGQEIQKLYIIYKEGKMLQPQHRGSYKEYALIPDYVTWLCDHFKSLKNMNLSAAIDCGNGAAGTVIPLLVQKMNWSRVTVLYPEVDGTYPHHEADPVKLENMQDVKAMMQYTDSAVGVGLDGDADRMAPMTKKGRLVSGDLMLGIFAQPIVHKHPGTAVVFDIKSSAALIDYLEELGAYPVMSPSGHSIVKKEMKKHHALIGGELSCHFFFHDRYFGYDDGIYAMLRLFEILNPGVDLDDLLKVYKDMYSSPEIRIACDEDKKKLIVQTVTDIFAQKDEVDIVCIDGVRVIMPYGWGLLRASNTQPMLSLRFESDTQVGLQKIKDLFIKALMPFYQKEYLCQVFGA